MTGIWSIKFLMQIGKSESEALALLEQAYGEHSMKKSTVFEWHRWFKKGWEGVHDEARNEQPIVNQHCWKF